MQPENIETKTNDTSLYAADLFAEPRDHANQWDVSGIWLQGAVPVQESEARAAAE
jgi:hypothetical protein